MVENEQITTGQGVFTSILDHSKEYPSNIFLQVWSKLHSEAVPKRVLAISPQSDLFERVYKFLLVQ